MTDEDFCADCGALLPGPCSDGCSDEINPAGREGFDGLVDRLMFEFGLDRADAETRAIEIMEEDAA